MSRPAQPPITSSSIVAASRLEPLWLTRFSSKVFIARSLSKMVCLFRRQFDAKNFWDTS
ncbi:hypothetical protein BOSEA31B_15008 [Hyphomicrobiales bacterium]|nr:hypothetical protein BOSEA31B_15008 [Hyphomicrobiales bacterium]CAH1701494.1 hypothetical protein BOSEA1005_21193 [Hyphomicrobiales bacterium]CAI0345451.1 hypothetical protein BO1005MUT1_390123 [Hyphomicrobiales bacterium]